MQAYSSELQTLKESLSCREDPKATVGKAAEQTPRLSGVEVSPDTDTQFLAGPSARSETMKQFDSIIEHSNSFLESINEGAGHNEPPLSSPVEEDANSADSSRALMALNSDSGSSSTGVTVSVSSVSFSRSQSGNDSHGIPAAGKRIPLGRQLSVSRCRLLTLCVDWGSRKSSRKAGESPRS